MTCFRTRHATERILADSESVSLIPTILKTCARCLRWERPQARPAVGANLEGWFNDNVCIYLYFIWGAIFLMIIDVATRYKLSAELANKKADTIMIAVFRNWMRIFRPMRRLVSDQEGGFANDASATHLER